MFISAFQTQVHFGAVFDMDGVIIRTSKLHENAWRQISINHNLNWDKKLDYVRDVFGTASPDSANLLFPGQISNELMPQICKEKNHIYDHILRKQITNIEVPGFRNFISNLKEANIPIALATSSPESEALFVLKSLGVNEYFDSVMDISKVTHPKPHPEIYIIASKSIGLKPEECIGFEDSFTGIKAINEAGMKCVVVGTTLSLERLVQQRLAYDMYISDFKSINTEILKRLFISFERGD